MQRMGKAGAWRWFDDVGDQPAVAAGERDDERPPHAVGVDTRHGGTESLA